MVWYNELWLHVLILKGVNVNVQSKMDFTGVIPISTGQNLVLWTNTKYNPKCRYKRADTGEGNARIEQIGSVHFKKERRIHKPRNARGEYMLIKAR